MEITCNSSRWCSKHWWILPSSWGKNLVNRGSLKGPHKHFISCFLCQQADISWMAHTHPLKSWTLPAEMGSIKKKSNICKTKNSCPICSEVPKQRDGLSNLALKVGQKDKMIWKYGSIVERVYLDFQRN